MKKVGMSIFSFVMVFLLAGSAFGFGDEHNTATATGGSATATTGPIAISNTATGGAGGAGGSASVVDNSKTYNTNTNINAPSATIERGAVQNDNKNYNTNANLNNNTNKNENRNTNVGVNVQGQDQKQGQVQDQKQRQGQVQSQSNTGTNAQSQNVNNGQVVSPTQETSVNIEAPVIPAGLGREFGGQTMLPGLQFVEPKEPKNGVMIFDSRYLPAVLTYAQASKLAGGGSVEVYPLGEEPAYRMDKALRTGGPNGELIGYVVGISSKSIVEAWGAAYKAGMEWGGDSMAFIKSATFTGKPSAFFIGLGGAYTHSNLRGSEKDESNVVGGSGLIGYSIGLQSKKVAVIFAVFQSSGGADKVRTQVGVQVKTSGMMYLASKPSAQELAKERDFAQIETGTYKPPKK